MVDKYRKHRWFSTLACCCLCFPTAAAAQGELDESVPAAATEPDAETNSSFSYGAKGLTYNPEASPTDLWIGLRFQMRADTHEGDLVEPQDLADDPDTLTEFRRARIKGGGILWVDWLDIYSEYDFPSETWLDYRATFALDDWLTLRVGQWKSEFSRERIDSSGKQQLVERSISNYWFTVDRQRGLAASARLAEGTGADTKLWLEWLAGSGLEGDVESGQQLWLGRVQWNPAGELLPFSQSDIARREHAVSSIALAGVAGQTAHTRYSSDGGGDLPGQQEGDYDLRQLLLETAVHYRGLGWQQELHWKQLDDRQTGAQRELMGGYAQLGSFLNEWWPGVPSALEMVGRYALVDPDRDASANTQQEWTLGANWFFNGHRNKLTVDYSWLDFEDPVQGESAQRLRLQWELSI